MRNKERKFSIINKDKCPSFSEITIINDEISEFTKTIGYFKNNVLCFYYKHGSLKFDSCCASLETLNIFLNVILENIKKYLKEIGYVGLVGFEKTELKQLNNVFKYMIEKRGYNLDEDENFIFLKI
jgi:hypothetical protein